MCDQCNTAPATDIPQADIDEAVKRGAELLNKKTAKTWVCAAEFDSLDELDMTSCDMCILGLFFGDYFKGLTLLDLGMGNSHGFSLPPRSSADSWERLTAAWKKLITEQRAAVAV